MRLWSVIVLCGFAVLGCADDDPVVPSLWERLGPNQVRAGRITTDDERIRGPNAKSRIGDYKIYNDRVQFVIADVDSALGFHPYGGGIIDADRVHDGEGASTFGEIIWSLDFSVLDTNRIEVVADGSAGAEARVRVAGTLGRLPLFDAILGGLLPPPTLEAEWTIDYVLAPGATSLRIEHELFNAGRTEEEVSPLVGFFFGVGARPFFERLGFSSSNSGAASPYYAAVGDGVSYLFAEDGADVSAIFGESGIMVANVGRTIVLRARERKPIVQHLYVGSADLAATRAAWRADRSAMLMHVGGVVVDDLGAPVPKAHVHVLEANASDPDRDYVTRSVAADGAFKLDVEPTDLIFVATTPDGRLSAPVSLAGEVRLVVPATGTLDVRIEDNAGDPLPAKVSLRRDADPLRRPPARYGEGEFATGLDRVVFVDQGTATVALEPGSWTAYVSRGLEYEVVERVFLIEAGGTASLGATLVRSVDTPGWMTMDPHLHAERSSDSSDSFAFKTRALVAENIELPVSTDHEAVGDFEPAIEMLGLGAWMRGIVGTEISTTRYGHFNAYPVRVDDDRPGHGRIDWYGRDPGGIFEAAHAVDTAPVVQANHPRSTSIGYFELLGFDRTAFVADSAEFSTAFDGIEVLNTCGDGALDRAEVLDWFEFLARGDRKFATATMDDHTAGRGELGVPLTYVRVDGASPRDVTPSNFRDAVAAGRLTVTCGPFITAGIGAAGIGDVATVTDRIDVDITVSAAGWVDVDEVLLIVDGRVRATAQVPPGAGGQRFQGTLSATVSADGWAIVWARGDEPHGPWAQGRPSFGFTNPIYFDRR